MLSMLRADFLVEQLEGVFVGLGSRQALRIAFGFGAAVVQIIERKLAESRRRRRLAARLRPNRCRVKRR